MRILADANIILRLAQPNSPQRPDIVSALAVLTAAKHEICVEVDFEFGAIHCHLFKRFRNEAGLPQNRQRFRFTRRQARSASGVS